MGGPAILFHQQPHGVRAWAAPRRDRGGSLDDAGGHRVAQAIVGAAFSAVVLVALSSPAVERWVFFGFPAELRPSQFLPSIAMSATAAAVLPSRVSRPSSMALTLVLALGAIPAISVLPQLPGEGLGSTFGAPFTFLGFLVAVAAVRCCAGDQSDQDRAPMSPTADSSMLAFLRLLVAAALVMFVVTFLSYGAGVGLSAWSRIYETRLAFRETLFAGNPAARYFLPWLTTVISPTLVGLGLFYRRWIPFWVGILIQVYGYSLSATKTSLFLPMLTVLVTVLIVRSPGNLRTTTLLAALAAPLPIIMVGDYFFTLSLFDTTALRAYLIPALMAGGYFDFFSVNEPAMLGHSILSGIYPYPYEFIPPRVVALDLGFGAETNANANMWADAFANFRVLGVLTFSAVLGGVLALLDRIAARRAASVGMLAVVGPAVSLTNNSLVTVLGAFGLALSVAIVAAAPRADSSPARGARPSREGDSGEGPSLLLAPRPLGKLNQPSSSHLSSTGTRLLSNSTRAHHWS